MVRNAPGKEWNRSLTASLHLIDATKQCALPAPTHGMEAISDLNETKILYDTRDFSKQPKRCCQCSESLINRASIFHTALNPDYFQSSSACGFMYS